MSTVIIDYDQLNAVAKSAERSANRMDDYINDLSKKVSGKYSSLEGGQSGNTSNSQYYVNQKIKKLSSKRNAYYSFASDIKNLSSRAQDIDKEVAKSINASKDDFINKHDYVQSNWWTDIKEWFIDMKNKCPLFEAICDLVQGVVDNITNLFRDLKHWYKCGGGKEWIGFGLAVLGAVAAVCLAIAACMPPICGIVAVCAAIGAVLAAVNAIANVATSWQAAKAKERGDPAWAKIYGDRDTVQDILREHNFKDGFWNKMSHIGAATLDAIQLVCDIVAIYDGVKHIQNTYRELRKYANQSHTRNFGQIFKDYLFNKENYAGNKMRDLIQKRADIRTLRNYKATKAMSIAQFEKSMSKWHKLGKRYANVASKINAVSNTVNKICHVLNGDKFSPVKTVDNYLKNTAKKFQIPKYIFKTIEYINNWKKNFNYNAKGFNSMFVRAG